MRTIFRLSAPPLKRSFPGPWTQARSQGGGGGRWGRSPPQNAKKKGERERKKENKVACMHVKLPPFNHFQSKIKCKFVLYEENTGHMHQIAPLTTSKCKKLSLCPPSHTPPRSLRSLGLSLRSLARYFLPPPKIKSWLRHSLDGWGGGGGEGDLSRLR